MEKSVYVEETINEKKDRYNEAVSKNLYEAITTAKERNNNCKGKISQVKISENCGITQYRLSKLKSGKEKMYVEELLVLSDELGISPIELLQGTVHGISEYRNTMKDEINSVSKLYKMLGVKLDKLEKEIEMAL